MSVKYGITEVFVKHDYYASLRIVLIDKENRIYIDEVDRAKPTDQFFKLEKKRYPAQKIVAYETDLEYCYCSQEQYGAFPRYKYIFHEGTSRSSKSYSIEEWTLREAESKKNLSINVWRDTRASLVDTVWNDFRQIVALSGRDIWISQKEASKIAFPNGSVISPKGADANDAMGATSDIAWLNEPYGITEVAFDQIDQRCNQMIVDVNPIGITWAKKVKNHPRCKVIYSTFQQNPFCPPEQKRKILGYEPWESGTYEVIDGVAIYKGNPISDTNQPPQHPINVKLETANTYNWMVFGLGLMAEKPHKIYHGWKTINLHDYENLNFQKYYGLDYGFANPSACVEIKYDGDRTFYVKPLLYKPINSLPIPLGEALISVGVPSGNVMYGWADSSDLDVANDISMTEDLRRLYALNFYPTNKPSYKARFDFITRARIIYVYDEEFEFEYNNYEFQIINGFNTEKPIKKNDHYMNALEYGMWGIKGVLGISW